LLESVVLVEAVGVFVEEVALPSVIYFALQVLQSRSILHLVPKLARLFLVGLLLRLTDVGLNAREYLLGWAVDDVLLRDSTVRHLELHAASPPTRATLFFCSLIEELSYSTAAIFEGVQGVVIQCLLGVVV
jgi:hypothetical protein